MGLLGRGGWLPIDTAPSGEDVLLQVTDGHDATYNLPAPFKLTASGWVSSTNGTRLAVTSVKWKPYNGQRSRHAR
jgi:hypothetical protein